jgi:predicted secreted protein
MTQQTHTITYHAEKEPGYQWKLRVEDDLSHMTIHFADQHQAEQYVIVNMLQFGELI